MPLLQGIVVVACLLKGMTAVEGQLISHSMLHFIDKGTLHRYNLSDPDEYVWREPLAKTGPGSGRGEARLPYTDVVHENKHTKKTQSYRVYTVVYATNITSKGFCTMAASAGGHGFQLNVLGEDRQLQFEESGCNGRLWVVRDFVTRIMALCVEGENPHRRHPSCDRTIVLYLDAYDVIFMGSPQKLIDKFLATQKNVLFGSEKGCCATREGLSWKHAACDPLWPLPPLATATPFLNAGVFVGFVQPVAILLQECWVEQQEYTDYIGKTFGPVQSVHVRPNKDRNNGPWNPYLVGGDQALICHVFAHRRSAGTDEHTGQQHSAPVSELIGMSLDYTSSIFLNVYDMQIGRELHITERGRVKYTGPHTPVGTVEGQRVRAITPLFLHFNGAGKEKGKMFVVAAKMAWPDSNRSTSVSHTVLYSLAHSKYTPLDATCSWRM